MRKKITKTARFVTEAQPLVEKHVPLPFPNTPPNREGIARLTFHWSPSIMESSTAQLASAIEDGALKDAIIIPDTNVFTRPMDELVWKAVLSRQLAITPMVWRELAGGPKPWRTTTPCCNAGLRDLVLQATQRDGGSESHDSTRIELLALDEIYQAHGYDYYLGLLALRKRIGPLYRDLLTAKLGRQPTQDEFVATVQGQLGERGLHLAKKGLENSHSPNLLTDEQLVVMAVLTAIMRGREVIILTGDADVLEQYFKLLYLMGGHYRGMLAAEKYGADPASMTFKPWPLSAGRNEDFQGDEILWHLTTNNEFEKVLPRRNHFVMVYCWLLHMDKADIQAGKLKVTQASFCAETEMVAMLQMKSRTGGLNTDKLGGRNCVPYVVPMAEKTAEQHGVSVFIGKDTRTKFGSWDHASADARIALASQEPINLLHYSPAGLAHQPRLNLSLFTAASRPIHALRPPVGRAVRARLALPRCPVRGIGRNDPCPCGSGKKFKKCCLGKR